MIDANHIKKGMALKLENDICLVTALHHHKPGKGAAVVRIKLKSFTKGTTVDRTYRSNETVEDIELDKRPASYSYDDGESIVFMDTQTYDEIRVEKSDIEEYIPYLKEGMELNILLFEERPVSVIPPTFVELIVSYAEDAVKGDTANNPTKEVKLESGAAIQVPLFVKQGDKLKIDLRDFSYVERVK